MYLVSVYPMNRIRCTIDLNEHDSFPIFRGKKTHKNKPEDGVSDPNTPGIF